MRLLSALFLSALVFMIFPDETRSMTFQDISLSSENMARGEVILINIKAGEETAPRVVWMGKEISFVFNRTRGAWQGFLAADLNQKEGDYEATVNIAPSDTERHITIHISDKDYGVRRLTLPKDKVELNAAALKRVNAEAEVVSAIWKAKDTIPAWKGIFLMPVDGEVVGIFGKRSVINGLERSPHTGLDLSGNAGTPVRAINIGKVILIADHFFTGNTVFLDHGGGIITMYCHLQKVLVKAGDRMDKGQVLGLVGATGRATGPHLHWGMRVNGARVNPLTLTSLSRELEE
jgi:murein DD-endopeptidase MepM/ murein hydrolase activator NlpD